MPQIIHGECANGGGGGGGGASPPATQASPTLGPWPPGGRVPVNDNNIDLPADSSDNVLHPRRRAAPGHDCRAEASAAGWESTASSSSSPNSAVTSSPNWAVTSSSSRLSLPPLSSAVASSSSPPAVPLSSSSPSPNYAITSSTSFQNSVSANAMFLILYGVASLMLSLVLVRWSYDIESHATPAHTNTTVHSVIILTAMLQLCMSRVQSNLDHWRWIGPELCWVVLLITGSKDIVSAGLPGSAPRYGLMNRIVTMTASLLGLLLFSACSFGISDLMFNLITKGKNLVPAIHLILVLAFLFAASDLMFNLSTGNNLVSAIHLKLASWCRYLNRKLVMVVSLLVLLLLALVFWGIHLPSDNSLAMKRGNEIKMVNNHQHSPERMLLSINHDTQGNVGKDDGIINDVLRMTTGNADGSVENQKAFPHWTSNQNKSIRQDYEEKRELQIVPGKSHLSAHKMIKTVVASSIAVASALVVVCYIFVLLWRKCGNRARIIVPLAPQLELCSRVTGCSRAFKYEELAAATNNFTDENKLGHGGFGPVYRGLLRDPDRHVAIKLLSAESSWQGQTEFEAEVNVLSQVRHRNIVQLVGWCQSNEGLLLVYELMAEGSLDKHLHNPVRILSWQQRYKIILDLGSALIYLHQCCDKCIVHGDIKPENVMLDASYNAKLGDFGTARLLEHGAEPRATEIVAGTRGYVDPEFVNNQMRCPEADMYSFGVALLEIASGKRPASRQPGEASALLVWVRHLYDQRRVLDAADGKMNGEFDRQQMERVLVTGLWCAHQDPSQRPFTEQAMDVLRSADASMPVLPATRDPQRVRILEEQAYGDLTGEGASVDAVAASTCYLTSKDDSAYLLAEE